MNQFLEPFRKFLDRIFRLPDDDYHTDQHPCPPKLPLPLPSSDAELLEAVKLYNEAVDLCNRGSKHEAINSAKKAEQLFRDLEEIEKAKQANGLVNSLS